MHTKLCIQDTQYRIQDTGYRTIVNNSLNQHYSVASTPSSAGACFFYKRFSELQFTVCHALVLYCSALFYTLTYHIALPFTVLHIPALLFTELIKLFSLQKPFFTSLPYRPALHFTSLHWETVLVTNFHKWQEPMWGRYDGFHCFFPSLRQYLWIIW